MEFNSFLRESDALKHAPTDAVQKIFSASKVHDEDGGNELHQHDFFNAVINVAVYKYIITASKSRSSVTKVRGGGRNAKLNPLEAITKLYDEHLRPYIEANLAGTSIKSAIASDEVLLIFKEREEQLSRVFSIYGDRYLASERVVRMKTSITRRGNHMGLRTPRNIHSVFCDVLIFVLPTKALETITRRRRTVLCFAHRVGTSVVVAVCTVEGRKVPFY